MHNSLEVEAVSLRIHCAVWRRRVVVGACYSQGSIPSDSQVAFAAELNNLQGGAQAALALFPSLRTGFEREVKIEL